MMKKKILILLMSLLYGMAFSQSFQVNKQIKSLALPTENIFEVAQDLEGRMWFATDRGIFYSDGINTYSLPKNVEESLGNNLGVKVDEDGLVWVYNSAGIPKVYYFEEEEWHTFDLPTEITDGGSVGYIKLEILGSKGRKKLFIYKKDLLGITNMTNPNWEYFFIERETQGELMSVYQCDKDDFVLYFKKSAYRLKNGTLSVIQYDYELLPGCIGQIAYNKEDENYYFLGSDFLAKGKDPYEATEIVHQGFSKVSYAPQKQFGLQVKKGQVYFFYSSQLFKYNPKNNGVLEITSFDALKAYYINTALVDRENIIWIGTIRGVVNLPNLRFQNFGLQDGFMEQEVSAIEKLGEKDFLFGFNNGIQYWKDEKLLYESKGDGELGEPKNRVTSFHRDGRGIVWIASSVRGVGRFDPEKKEAVFYKCPSDRIVANIFIDGEDLYIVAGLKVYKSNIYTKGAALFKRDITDSFFKELTGKAPLGVRKINKDKDGRFVLMTLGSLYEEQQIIQNEKVVMFRGYDWTYFKGEMVLGTPEGLKVVRDGEARDYIVKNQKINRPVYALLNDTRGHLWIGTDQGVTLLNGETIRLFDAQNGLSGNEINRGALIKGDEGQVMIGTQNGLSIYMAQEDEDYVVNPMVSVGNIKVLGTTDGDINIDKIPYAFNNVSIEFSAISFLELDNFTVSYKLLGLHEDWQTSINPRTNFLQFNNLPAGDYQLVLKASLGGQFESEMAYSDSFSVVKPVYLQFWFIGLLMFFFLMIGFGLNMIVNQFKEQGLLKKSIDEKNLVIKTAEDQFRNVWESSQDGLVLTHTDGTVIALNPAIILMSGVNLENAKNINHVKELFKDKSFFYKNRREIVGMLRKTDGEGGSFEVDIPFYSALKSIELFVTRVNPKNEEHEVILIVFRDVTDKKIYEKGLKEAKEKAEEANRIKTNFLSSMSHEIRTPLNGILGSTENIILQNPNNQALIGQLEIIMESGERLLNTINSILDMSKIEANKMEVVYEETNVNDFLSKILLPLKTLAIKKNLLLTAKFETKPLIVNVDKRYLEMIVNNIVGNAIKYSNEGLIQINVKKHNRHICLCVKDMGIGMSEEFVKNIYQPFEQESGGYDRKFEGTGLGLSITKNLVEILGGSIEIESVQKEGTTVRVKLPIN
ncbi:PAS domain S-box protein [Echinicola marina]|uniref:sensor histidine kinase n=1 Tax=Echinicola marina TaxID=2859768 RepID=UPI001CF678B2|nr:ATP-binding protein [Echinicola marina]UCS93478.1 PAS domain S-box protein [Echinicola marina]